MKTTGKQEIIVFTIKNIMRSDYIFDIKNNEINKMTKTRALQILEDIATFAKDAGNEEWTKEIEQAEQYIEDHLPDDGYFPITSIAREDIKRSKDDGEPDLKDVDVQKITDDEMKQIASKMGEAYTESVFWIDLPIIVKAVLEE